ncbi:MULTISPECIES: dTDP-4-dehydrorhamnose 3,5-epimerase family protein [unclassified Cyanobium]|uniref:dTDP-4-dehydrorhamnose 3,5-epimerase family protein n=1 Tax=unclassified Cyanobium TaxID=2627006 RepID=UPI0020CDBDDD|nr:MULTISPECIES: dTDP-4-dehydrorhamnose 3,5-epimerase family protein [unclassified Cyanobium]MCP9778601.1 dTDP-4-dehydrorhamnose 3,5-epimerase family protein [Cyanobium sp. Tous-M-B4]MCP9876233.1 dTDP-4-dehydrorhamnose 3,5-epimerase family protein [Cyanobium sp. A2C-AMD]
MQYEPLAIAGAFKVTSPPIGDERGWFARAFCQKELLEHGVDFQVRQINRSYNQRAGTLRGFHFQFPPYAEHKFLRCVGGELVDVLVDLRPESPTFLQTEMVELRAEDHQAVLIPERCCHALQTLTDATEILYQVSEFYTPEAEFGLRWNDPELAISWPLEVSEISPKDASWPLLNESLASIREQMTLSEGLKI